MNQLLPIAAYGTFPAAFTAVYVVGAIVAIGLGIFAVKKANAISLDNLRAKNLQEDEDA
jgi:hypothetical protein